MSRRKNKTKQPKEQTSFDVWRCKLCGAGATSGPAITAHLNDAHQIPPGQGYKKTILLHIVATTWYQTDYTYGLDGKIMITRCVREPRLDVRGYW